MKTPALLAAAAAMSLFATQGIANETDMSDANRFDLADFDQNGCVDWEEFRNRAIIVYKALDLNQDGMIEGEEHIRAVDDEGEPVYPESVDIARFTVALKIAFDDADSDASKCLSEREWGEA